MNGPPREEQFKSWLMQAQPFITIQRVMGPLTPNNILTIRRELEAAFYAGQEATALHLASLSEHPP